MQRLSKTTLTALVVGLVVLLAAGAFALGRLTADSPEDGQTAKTDQAGQTASSAETSSPTEPAPAGAELPHVTSPPAKSLWALSAETYQAGARIAVEFEPYGVGPSSFGPSIVALVSSAEPEDSAAKVPDLAGRNVVFLLGGSVVDKGGRYAGVAVTQAQQDRIVLVLEDVKLVAQK